MIVISEVTPLAIPAIARGFFPLRHWLHHAYTNAHLNNGRVWVHIDWDKEYLKFQFLSHRELEEKPELLYQIMIPENWR